ncbi:MAG TPA: hypothetical protein VFX30_10040 [bacterium]|nr:hypothetical protein [bacterium]
MTSRLAAALVAVSLFFCGAGVNARDRLHNECPSHASDPTVVWCGSSPDLTFQELAASLGPILAFSPDEPLLEGTSGKAIRLPEAMPFESKSAAPVVYYRLRNVFARHGGKDEAVTRDFSDRNRSTLNLDSVDAVELDYFFYYSGEAGVGSHPHDIESVEFKANILRNPDCACPYAISVGKVLAKAHGIDWFDNALYLDKKDEEVKFPMTVMVEEGKHASCPDRNGDGIYSPGYDVNRRLNDAWGVRDIIRSGSLLTGGYQSWMTKPRPPEYLVVPPLPKTSPLYGGFVKDRRELTRNKAVYRLRPFPGPANVTDDEKLRKMVAEKQLKKKKDWPEVSEGDNLAKWLTKEPFLKSIGVAYRYDGDHGLAVTVPFLVVKNFEVPVAGGWLVHRITLDDHNFQDFGYSLLYTRSASRWVGGYFALGYDKDKKPSGSVDRNFAVEGGVKFRVNLEHSFLRPITKVTTRFWGLRLGIRNLGVPAVDHLGYVVEVGAGVW